MTAIKQDGPYDSRTLTKVFLGSSLALAATTVWMVLDDHTRRWRGYQEDFREIEISRKSSWYPLHRRVWSSRTIHTVVAARARLEPRKTLVNVLESYGPSCLMAVIRPPPMVMVRGKLT